MPPTMDESPPVFTLMAEGREEKLEAPPDMDEPLSSERPWPCPQCHKPVPSTFDVCWNCGTSRNGSLDPSFIREPLDIPRDEPEEPATQEAARHHGLQCPKCGSSKIIPKARVLAHGEHSGDVQVVIYGNPQALIFTAPLFGRLTADICGDCGHVELRVANPEELYEHYRQAAT